MINFNATQKDINQAERIRRQYLDEEADKMKQLKKLDDKVKAPGKVVAGVLGVTGSLVMGGGMAFVMEWSNLTIGLALGIPGIIVALAAYPLYLLITKKRKKKYASEIMCLSDAVSKQ